MKKHLLLFVFPIFLWSCSHTSETKTVVNASDTTINFVDKTKTDVRKVDLKSAIIHMTSSVMGLSQSIIVYMDDYGKKQATEVTQELLGKKIHQYSVNDSLYIYSFNPEEKKGQKAKIDENNPDDINFNSITREMAQRFHLRKKGTATVIGKKCDVYAVDFAGTKLQATFYIWKGIPLKTESTVSGISVKMEATKIEENVPIAAEKFQIPNDIVFEETAKLH